MAIRLVCLRCHHVWERPEAVEGMPCPKCGAVGLPSTAPPAPPRRTRREPIWPLLAMSLVLIAGVIWAAVLFWPRGSNRDTPDDENKGEGEGGPTLLIATEEGINLLADVLELETTRVQERRGRHAKEAQRRAGEQIAQARARKQTVINSEEQLRRLLMRLPGGADKTALTDIAGKLNIGPALGPQERLLAAKYPEVFAELLQLTRNGLIPLREVERRAADEQKLATEKDRQAEKRFEEQVKFLERLGPLIFEEKDVETAFALLTRMVQARSDFAEARTLRGTLLCVARGDYGPAAVDCDNAIRLDQRDAAALFIRGLCHWKRGSRNQAGVDYQAATLLEPRLERYRELFDPRD